MTDILEDISTIEKLKREIELLKKRNAEKDMKILALQKELTNAKQLLEDLTRANVDLQKTVINEAKEINGINSCTELTKLFYKSYSSNLILFDMW